MRQRSSLHSLRVRSLIVLVALTAWPLPCAAQTTTPDSTYGPGGTKSTSTQTLPDGSTEETATIRDKGGVVRERITKTVEANRDEVTRRDWYDAAGTQVKQTLTKRDAAGRQYYSREDDFKDGVLESGAIVEDENGRPVHKRYNKTTQRYEPVDPPNEPFDLFKIPGFEEHVDINHSLYIGASFVAEDATQLFWTTGANISYTHALTPTWGIVADVQWTRGERDDVTFTKMQGFVGLALCQHAGAAFYFAPRLLVGVSYVTSEYGPTYGGVPGSSTTDVAVAAGFDIGRRITDRLDLSARVEYTPTFANAGIQHSVRLGAGLKIRF